MYEVNGPLNLNLDLFYLSERFVVPLKCVHPGNIIYIYIYKMAQGNKTVKWWHVVSAYEKVIQALENTWNKVYIQTSWRLLPCLTYETNVSSNEHSNNNILQNISQSLLTC